MRAGKVVRIRLNPQDCMGVVDVLATLRIRPSGMSMASAASLALSTMLESFRKDGKIPRRAGFEYDEMVKDLNDLASVPQKQKILTTNQLYNSSMKGTMGETSMRTPAKPEGFDTWSAEEKIKWQEQHL